VRLIDALSLAGGLKGEVEKIYVARRDGRTLEIPAEPLLHAQMQWNVVIRAGDSILAPGPRREQPAGTPAAAPAGAGGDVAAADKDATLVGEPDVLAKVALGPDKKSAIAAMKALLSVSRENPGEKAARIAPVLDDVLASKDADPEVRVGAAATLGEIALMLKPERPWAGVVRVAGDKSAPVAVRVEAFKTLGQVPRPDSLEPVLDGLLDGEVKVREAAFDAWVNIIGTTPPAAPRPDDPESGLPAITAENTYHPVTNVSKAFVERIKGNIGEWKDYLEKINKRMKR
jgi:hypothetical protein